MLNLTDHLELLVSLENPHDRMYIAYLITRDILCERISAYADLVVKLAGLKSRASVMTGKEAVQGWARSDGHKKMMQCTSAVKAGAAVIRSNDKWYYAIVYDFVGSNQSA